MTTTAPTPIIRTFDDTLYAAPVPAIRHHGNRRRTIAHRAAPAPRARHRYAIAVTVRPPLLPRVQRALRIATYALVGICILLAALPGVTSGSTVAAITLAVWLTGTLLNRPRLRRALIRWYLIHLSDRA